MDHHTFWAYVSVGAASISVLSVVWMIVKAYYYNRPAIYKWNAEKKKWE